MFSCSLFALAFLSYALVVDENDFKIDTIVIDAGHGGKDPGCSGLFSQEKDVALDIALKLGKLIEENYPDVKVIYTRKTDVFIELYERARIANSNRADLFISIHCNAFTNKASYGTETYVMGQHKNTANLLVAKRENAVIILEEDFNEHYDGFNPNSPQAHIIFSLYQNAYLDQSILLATRVEEFFNTKRKSRGVKQAGFLVLYKTAMPSVIVETGFLTNEREEKYLNSKSGQDEIAYTVFLSFKDFKKDMEGFTGKEKKHVEVIKEKNTTPPKQDQSKETIDKTRVPTFKVQICASAKPIDLSSQPYSSLSQIETDTLPDGMVKFRTGNFTNINSAITYQQKLRKSGFTDAFVVAFYQDKRISIKEAREMLDD
ncbi:MAG: N-acetylmuramoyl-L-alanine amidase [Bacteroidetes bacterium]|nr:N-acetylmuramoyl-L-alanine amidase [Bacteroidota bacterium]